MNLLIVRVCNEYQDSASVCHPFNIPRLTTELSRAFGDNGMKRQALLLHMIDLASNEVRYSRLPGVAVLFLLLATAPRVLVLHLFLRLGSLGTATGVYKRSRVCAKQHWQRTGR